MLKCINGCCHLEVAHTVDSLQSFFFSYNAEMHTVSIEQLRNSLNRTDAGKSPKWAVLWCIMHTMQKKCIPVGLYRLLCLKAREGREGGGRELQSGSCFRAWLLHSVTSDEQEKPTDVFTLQNLPLLALQVGPWRRKHHAPPIIYLNSGCGRRWVSFMCFTIMKHVVVKAAMYACSFVLTEHCYTTRVHFALIRPWS